MNVPLQPNMTYISDQWLLSVQLHKIQFDYDPIGDLRESQGLVRIVRTPNERKINVNKRGKRVSLILPSDPSY